MSMMDINLVIGSETISFQMTFDPNFWSDIGMREYLLRNGLAEPGTVHLMKRVLRPGDIAIDGGANVGFFTVLMSKLVGKVGFVLAFEPGINNIQKFHDNIALNHVANVKLVQQPLWHTPGEEVTFNLCHDSGINSLGDLPEVLCRLKMRSTALSEYPETARARLVKLDIEGSEQFAIEGLGDARPPFVVFEFNAARMRTLNSTFETLRAAGHDRGYELFVLDAAGGLPALLARNIIVASDDPQSPNLLFSTVAAVESAWNKVESK